MLKPTLSEVIDHIRNRTYMSGVQRTQARIKATGEVFTPTPLVQEMLDQLPQELFTDPTKTFIDNSCGDGQFLGEVLIRKLQSLNKEEITDAEFEAALSTVYGVDIMQDNVDECRERLLCGREDLRHIVEQNIYQANSLEFSYEFKPMSSTRRKREDSLRRKIIKEKKKAANTAHAEMIFGFGKISKSKGKKQPVDQ